MPRFTSCLTLLIWQRPLRPNSNRDRVTSKFDIQLSSFRSATLLGGCGLPPLGSRGRTLEHEESVQNALMPAHQEAPEELQQPIWRIWKNPLLHPIIYGTTTRNIERVWMQLPANCRIRITASLDCPWYVFSLYVGTHRLRTSIIRCHSFSRQECSSRGPGEVQIR